MLRLKIIPQPLVKKTYTEQQLKKFREVQDTFVLNKCTLLSTIDEYVDKKSIMKFKCSCGNPDAKKTFDSFRDVPYCNEIQYLCFSPKKRKKLEKLAEEHKKLFESFGCILLDLYKPQKEKWRYICSCGREDKKYVKIFRLCPHCKKCDGIVSIEDMKNKYLSNGCKLLDNITRCDRKLSYNFICHCGENDCKTYVSFENSPMCYECDKQLYLKGIESKYEEHGCILLDKDKALEITNKSYSPIPLLFKCECGNDKCSKTFNAFCITPHCDECTAKLKKIQYKNHSISYAEMKRFLEERGYIIITTEDEYVNGSTGALAFCPRKHKCHVHRNQLNSGSSCCSKCGNEERVKTMLAKYGVTNSMHNPESLLKMLRNSACYKIYIFPSGQETMIQGYEHFCLNDLLKIGIKEEEIVTQLDREDSTIKMPVIPYKQKGRNRKYYPDFYIPHLNVIIEVKSIYTFERDPDKNLLKKEACIQQGYKFEFYFYNHKGQRIQHANA